jgi:hypothetical protein
MLMAKSDNTVSFKIELFLVMLSKKNAFSEKHESVSLDKSWLHLAQVLKSYSRFCKLIV